MTLAQDSGLCVHDVIVHPNADQSFVIFPADLESASASCLCNIVIIL